MKRFLLICVLASVILIPAFSETSGECKYNNAAAIDPAWILVNTYRASYERMMIDQVSVIVDASYSPDVAWGLHEYNVVTYFSLIGEGRYYFGHFLKKAAEELDLGNYGKYFIRIFTDGPGGLYAGAFGSYKKAMTEDGEGETFYKAVGNGFGGGLELGCKYIFGEGDIAFFLEPYAQFEILTGSFTYKDEDGDSRSKPSDFDDDYSSGFRGGIKVGIVF